MRREGIPLDPTENFEPEDPIKELYPYGHLFSADPDLDGSLKGVKPEMKSGPEEASVEKICQDGTVLPGVDPESVQASPQPESAQIASPREAARDYHKDPMTDEEFKRLPPDEQDRYSRIGRPGTPQFDAYERRRIDL